MFTLNVALGAGLGLVIGAFIPKAGRYVKSFWVKETTVGKSGLKEELKKVESKL